MSSSNYFTNKTIWITGASSGIGKALAIRLSEIENTKLILSSRSEMQLNEVKSLCQDTQSVEVLPLDLVDTDSHTILFEKYNDSLSKVDIVFHNGGISQRSLALETDFSVYKKLIDVNYLGTVSLTLKLLPFFKNKSTGHFVVTTSSAGKFGVPMRSGYSGSKFALHGFFEALRAELHNSGIKITMICPGFIKTDISKHSLTADGSLQGTMDDAQLNGMPVEDCVNEILKSVSQQKAESYIGGFKETKMAVLISRLFPNLFRKIIANSKVT
ncbi:SDR family NAD(P)-dependent oxidoreductase [Saprospiraceae bacterium]|nr:SDR family NAD(P)-dependent oxidoreductase [Saprospiraceae bacterium]